MNQQQFDSVSMTQVPRKGQLLHVDILADLACCSSFYFDSNFHIPCASIRIQIAAAKALKDAAKSSSQTPDGSVRGGTAALAMALAMPSAKEGSVRGGTAFAAVMAAEQKQQTSDAQPDMIPELGRRGQGQFAATLQLDSMQDNEMDDDEIVPLQQKASTVEPGSADVQDAALSMPSIHTVRPPMHGKVPAPHDAEEQDFEQGSTSLTAGGAMLSIHTVHAHGSPETNTGLASAVSEGPLDGEDPAFKIAPSAIGAQTGPEWSVSRTSKSALDELRELTGALEPSPAADSDPQGEGAEEEDGGLFGAEMSPEAMSSALASLLPGSEQLEELQDVLRKLHYDNQQEVSFDKISEGLARLGYRLSPFEVETLLREVAGSSNTSLSQSQFIASQIDWRQFQTNHREEWLDCLKSTFNDICIHGQGRLQTEDLVKLLRDKLPEGEVNLAVEEILMDVGSSIEGLDFDDFCRLVREDSRDSLSSMDLYDARYDTKPEYNWLIVIMILCLSHAQVHQSRELKVDFSSAPLLLFPPARGPCLGARSSRCCGRGGGLMLMPPGL